MANCATTHISEFISRHGTTLALVFSLAVSRARAQDGCCSYAIEGKKLKVLTFLLPLENALPVLEEEGDVAVYFANSPDQKRVVVLAGNYDQNDFWIIEREKYGRPAKLNVSAGRNVGAKWYGNRYFGISWGGMGYSSAALFRTSNLSTPFTVDNLISFLPRKGIYVAGYLGQGGKYFVDLGIAFSNVKPERFPLPLEPDDPVSAWQDIVEAEVTGRELIVKYLKKGAIHRKSFQPALLRGVPDKS